MARGTIIAKEAGIPLGSVVELKAVPDDAAGVEVLYEGRVLGSVSNDPNLVIKQAAVSALQIRRRILDRPECESVSGLIYGYEKRKSGKDELHLFAVETYVVPRKKDASEAESDVRSYTVGGRNAVNPCMAGIKSQLKKHADEHPDSPDASIPVVILKVPSPPGTDPDMPSLRVCLPNDVSVGASAGEIKKPDDFLAQHFAINETMDAQAVRLSGRDYIIQVVNDSSAKTDNLYEPIRQAVKRCAGQYKAVLEKAEYMVRCGFDEKLSESVINQMPSCYGMEASPNPRQKYYQRSGCNLADMVSYMLFGKTVRLVGEKGSGKNTLVETACWLLNRPLCRVQGSSELDKLDLLGSRTLSKGSTGFELSEFLRTLRDDGIAVIDEANTIRPEVLTIVHSLTDGARGIDVPGYGPVKLGPHACIIYTMNEDYVGTGEMNAATIDRGPSMYIEQETDLSGLLKEAVPSASDKNIRICCVVSEEVRKAAKNSGGALTSDAVTVRGYIDALQCAEYIPLRRALIQNVANKLQNAAERQAVERIIASIVA